MSWIEDADPDVLRIFAKHTAINVLISNVDGSILWANHAFCEFSKYTLQELIHMGWIKLSVQDNSFEADMAEAVKLDRYNVSYSVTKQYIPRNSAPVWGVLHVMRYPATGEMKYCICTFQPIDRDSGSALDYAVSRCDTVTLEVARMREELLKLTSQTAEQQWVYSTVQIAMKHPKVVMAILVAGGVLSGANNLVGLMQRMGIVDLPIKLPIVIDEN